MKQFGVRAEGARRGGEWVPRGVGGADKIAAVGVRIRHWISFHGVAINVAPDLVGVPAASCPAA